MRYMPLILPLCILIDINCNVYCCNIKVERALGPHSAYRGIERFTH